jgi:hypothetical protein
MYTFYGLEYLPIPIGTQLSLVHTSSHQHFRLCNVRWKYHYMPFNYILLKPDEND